MKSNTSVSTDSEFSQVRVPASAKQGFWQIAFIMVGFTFFSPSMMAGGRLGLGLTFAQFVLAVVLGNAFLALYTGILAYISQKTGMTLDLLARRAFGEKGSQVCSALISITQMGWFGVGVAMFAIPVGNLLGISPYILVAIVGALMTLTAALGVKALAIFGGIAVPLIALLGSYSVTLAAQQAGGFFQMFSEHPAEPLSMTAALGIVIANFISGGTATPNFARFGKSAKSAVGATVLAFFVGNIIMFVFGAAGAAVYQEPDIFNVLILQGLTIPAILTLGLNIWSTNNNALYTAGLGFSNITKKSMKATTILGGVLGTVLAVYLYNNFVGYLSVLGSMIPPVGVVLSIHYFRHREQYLEDSTENAPLFSAPALVAVAFGIVAGLFLPVGISALNALVASGVSFLIGDHFFTVPVQKPVAADLE